MAWPSRFGNKPNRGRYNSPGGQQTLMQSQQSLDVKVKLLNSQTEDCLKVIDRYVKLWVDNASKEDVSDEKEKVLTSLALYRMRLKNTHKKCRENASVKKRYQKGFAACNYLILSKEEYWTRLIQTSLRKNPKTMKAVMNRLEPVLAYMRKAIETGDVPVLSNPSDYEFNAENANAVMAQVMLHTNHKTPEKVEQWNRNSATVNREMEAQARAWNASSARHKQVKLNEKALYHDAYGDREFALSLAQQQKLMDEERMEALRFVPNLQHSTGEEHGWEEDADGDTIVSEPGCSHGHGHSHGHSHGHGHGHDSRNSNRGLRSNSSRYGRSNGRYPGN